MCLTFMSKGGLSWLIPSLFARKQIVVVMPSDFAEMSIPDWVQGGTLSPVIEDPPRVCPRCWVMDMCCLAIGCSRHPILSLRICYMFLTPSCLVIVRMSRDVKSGVKMRMLKASAATM